MASTKKYWKNEAELDPNDSLVNALRQNEFPEEIPVDDFLGDKQSLSNGNTSRRDFLKYVGFSTAAASLAACEGPVNRSIPYVVKPETIIPGVANFYASTIANGFDFASILVKTREGRPIKIERNKDAKTGNGSSARIQASVLNLYDSTRFQGPKSGDQDISWEILDATAKAKINALSGTERQIVFLTQTYASPTTAKLVSEFIAAHPNTKHVTYDAISEDAALSAFEAKYGSRALPDYDFGKAEVIVSFGADFLVDWQGGDYSSGYAKGRVPKEGKMSKHIQFESNMTLTGGNADHRIAVTPSQQRKALAALFGKLNGTSVNTDLSESILAAVEAAAKAIGEAGSKALVVTGISDVRAQSLILAINEMTSSEAVDTEAPRLVRNGNDTEVQQLISDMNAGNVGLLVMDGVNPLYTLANAANFASGLEKVDVSIAFATNRTETTEGVNYIAAANHFLESWGDAELKKGHFSLMQPTIKQLFDTRQIQTSLLKWLDKEESYYDYLKANWESGILNGSPWYQAVHDGIHMGTPAEVPVADAEAAVAASEVPAEEVEATTEMDDMAAAVQALASSASGNGFELTLYSKASLGDGQMANNPWLQEFPDPITRVSWDNYLTISKADAQNLELVNENVANGGLDGSYVNLTANGVTISNIPVIIQPGQAPGSVGLSLGYGRKVGLKEEMQTGVNAYTIYADSKLNQNVQIEKAEGTHEFACIQLQQTLMGRGDIIKETTLSTYNTKDASEWNHVPQVSLDHQEVPATTVDLWDSFDRSIGHHFNMSIDLNACTGCGACVVACHAENNIAVVGKQEVRRSRDMHWLRIDRYYSSEENFADDIAKKEELSGAFESKTGFEEMEDPAANPKVAFQPVMCQHCNHAPCETVCPVAATTHSRQGQNHMAYNRCVGTRYCANNCPYKVRRFNWFLYNNNEEFDYHFNDDLGKMVINPDVTVRSRGVIEKCSLCIQMTQKSILDAKREGREVKDEKFQTACSNACDTGAIVFGDINNKESEVSKLKESNRVYHLLESVGTRPNVFYHVKVRNTDDA